MLLLLLLDWHGPAAMACDACYGRLPPSAIGCRPFVALSQAYLQELVAALSKAPRWGGGVLHADPLVANQLSAADRDDNFLVYAVACDVMSTATYQYAVDRHGAPGQSEPQCAADDPGGLASITRLRREYLGEDGLEGRR